MFEKASRLKLRFNTDYGNVATEDLWDLHLTHRSKFTLDDLAKDLHRQVKDSEEVSFVVKKSSANEILELKFEIVKHIIEVKLKEAEEAEQAETRKMKKQKLLELIDSKKNAALGEKSIEELEKMVAEM